MFNNNRSIPAFSSAHGWIKEVWGYNDPRNKYDKNEIRVYEDGVCEIDVYDSYGKYQDTGLFSEEDLEEIRKYKWYKDNVGYLSTTIGNSKIRMHRFLFPNELTDHKNSNKLDNRRENLQQISHALNISKITNKVKNKHGVTGIFLTPSNTWQASIEVNKKRKTKNYKTKEEAILQRYIWELNYWKENSPQIKDIKQKYPGLVKAMKAGYLINEDATHVNNILQALEKKDNFCPCRIKKDDTTRCMCQEFRKQDTAGPCHCGLYEKIEVEN